MGFGRGKESKKNCKFSPKKQLKRSLILRDINYTTPITLGEAVGKKIKGDFPAGTGLEIHKRQAQPSATMSRWVRCHLKATICP